MKEVAVQIREVVNEAEGALAAMSVEEVCRRDEPDSWSKQEILGHLIDSATNNHQRFVRACSGIATTFPPYNQENWVRIQRYNESDWSTLVKLWSSYNRHLSDVIERIPESALSSPCNVGKPDPVTLEFVVRDYLRHLRHHMSFLVGDQA